MLALLLAACGGTTVPTAPSPTASATPGTPAAPTAPTAPTAGTTVLGVESIVVDGSFVGGQAVTGTVTLTGPAPDGGLTITLTSSRSELHVPEQVTIAAGTTRIPFSVTSSVVTEFTRVQVTGSLGAISRTIEVVLRPVGSPTPGAPTLSALTPVAARRGSTASVTFTGTGFVADGTTLDTPAGLTASRIIVRSDTTLTADLAVNAGATVADYVLTVTTAKGTSNPVRFAVQPIFVAPPGSVTLTFTGAEQTFVVPPGITSIQVVASGAQGGAGGVSGPTLPTPGGFGGQLDARLPVTPGETLRVFVGGAGQDGGVDQGGAGGFNGGGGGGSTGTGFFYFGPGGGGGGASHVSRGPVRLVVAGGGGGSGGSSGFVGVLGVAGWSGGAGGGTTAASGQPLAGSPAPGLPGTQLAGGLGGAAASGGSGGNGTASVGGIGGTPGFGPPNAFAAGGGGGGGYFAGGGGAAEVNAGPGAGGGGGSSYATPGATVIANQTGVRTGNGLVIISW